MKIVRYITKDVERWATRHGYDSFALVHPMIARLLLLKCETRMEKRAWGVTDEEPYVIINPDMKWIGNEENPYKAWKEKEDSQQAKRRMEKY